MTVPTDSLARQRARAHVRIAADLAHALLVPVRLPAPAPPPLQQRPALVEGPVEPPTGGVLRLLSWNVHRGYGLPGLASSLVELVHRNRPHAVLLQEVPVLPEGAFWELDGVRDALLGYHLSYAPMHRVLERSAYYPFETSGQLTASWTAPVTTRAVALPVVCHPKLGPAHRIARLALITGYGLVGRRLRLAHVHLENTTGPGGRRAQLQAVLAHLPPADGIDVVAGDLNTALGPLEGVLRRLIAAGFARAPAGRSLLPRLDWVAARGAAVTARRLPTGGSDHRPVLAEIVVGA